MWNVNIIVISGDTIEMRYPGGKGKCCPRLMNLMPMRRTYIEPYLDGGAVMRHKRPAENNISIDRDAKVISSWEMES